VNDINDFVTLVRDEIGLRIDRQDVDRSFDEVPGWDSVHLLQLIMALERQIGRRISMPDVLEARSLEDIFLLVAAV
jgi:acyl carrier protein